MSGETPDIRRPTITPARYRTEGLPAELRETAAVRAAIEALRGAVDQMDGEPGRDAAGGGLARGVGRTVLLLDLRRRRHRGPRERGELRCAQGRGSR